MAPEDYVKLSIEYRGLILHEIIQLEIGINLYLMEFFCRDIDREIDFQNMILGDERMTLSSKVQVVQNIITNYDKEWGLTYVSIMNDDRKKGRIPLNSDLQKMIEHRNIFAHRMLDETNFLLNHADIARDKETVRFVKFKDELFALDYTDENFGKIINCIQNMANYLVTHKFKW
ncbi:hypothetical protein [Mucilaginibacter antarcticus]|uniref:MAE-28990/MAE-18760-like HEPN domain-containing protein n=2 Tax=Mucilaginibacter antarcticus TaxID=1855725 RepID=A0ABW5XMH0_9SPHI